MITGFNTDIEHEGVIYHVQTEDKGRTRPIILSLVYNGGTILASKRSPYDDLLNSNFSERVLAERLNKQHRLICAAIQAGRIEDLKQMTAREAAAARPAPQPSVAVSTAKPEIAAAPSPVAAAPMLPNVPPLERPKVELRPIKPISLALDDLGPAERPIPKPNFVAEEKLDQTGLIDEPIIEAVAVIEDEEEILVLPDDAVSIIDESFLDGFEDQGKLSVEMLGNARFRGGERYTVGFMVSRGTQRKVIAGAQVMVKILGSSFRPVIFHASTDGNGVATVNMQLPSFTSGRAALLVRAISDGEEVELRRSIAHG